MTLRVAGVPWSAPSVAVLMVAYLSAIAISELLLREVGFVAGGLAHLFVMAALALQYLTGRGTAHRPLLAVLLILPLLRLASLTAVVGAAPVAWYFLAGLPATLALFLVARAVGRPLRTFLGRPPDVALQVIIALSGVLHGALAFALIRPAPLLAGDPAQAALAIVAIVIFGAGLEELLFRGVLQSVLEDASRSRWWAVALAAAAYACMFLSFDSVLVAPTMLALGVFFGVVVVLTGSLWGVMGARALMLIGLLIVWPRVFG